MAKPRVLVSSTCYDLYLIREQLRNLIEDMGYDAVLSENGDIFYSPDFHVHLSCLNDVQNCDMIVLIIGNKFGSEYILDPKKSITQKEHELAHLSAIPIFSFIDQKVLHDFSIYRKVIENNKTQNQNDINSLLHQIPFNSNPDLKVFEFIDDVCRKSTNNGYFPFSNFGDIRDTLKKQWAGMIYDFLNQRKEYQSNKKILNLLSQVEIASTKIEQVVDLMAKKSIPNVNKNSLELIDNTTDSRRLYRIFFEIWDSFAIDSNDVKRLHPISKKIFENVYKLLKETDQVSEKEDSLSALQKYLMEVGILKKNAHYVHYLSGFKLLEFHALHNKKEFSKKEVLDSLEKSLIELARELSYKQKK